jgi:hypothetical protein
MKVFRFVPTGSNSSAGTNTITGTSTNTQTTGGSVLAAHITKNNAAADYQPPSRFDDVVFPAIAVISFVLYILGDRFHTIRQARKAQIQNK